VRQPAAGAGKKQGSNQAGRACFFSYSSASPCTIANANQLHLQFNIIGSARAYVKGFPDI
jgi:hypothetical protein